MRLKDIALVTAGHPFRRAIPDDGEGSHVVQMRNVDSILGINWNRCIQTKIHSKKTIRWLETGDILFLARGTLNFATCVTEAPEMAVVAPQFHVIRVTSNVWAPEALAAYLSRGPFAAWADENASGIGNQRHISLAKLKDAPIPLVRAEIQKELINMSRQLVVQEKDLLALRSDVIGYNERRLEEINWLITPDEGDDESV